MTSAERAYRALRHQAIRFQIKPGQRLHEVELAESLGMSRAPVREAMNRLVTEGLLTVVPNHGFSCRKLSAAEIVGLYAARADLEVGGVHEARNGADPAAIKALADFWDEVVAQADRSPIDALIASDEDFHLRLAALGGNRERVRLLEHINARIYFVRLVNLDEPGPRGTTLTDHREITVRLLAKDFEGAAGVLRRHLTPSPDETALAIHRGLARIYAESVA